MSPVQDFPEDKWDDIIAVCLNSAFHTTKAALPYMLDQVRHSNSCCSSSSCHGMVRLQVRTACLHW